MGRVIHYPQCPQWTFYEEYQFPFNRSYQDVGNEWKKHNVIQTQKLLVFLDRWKGSGRVKVLQMMHERYPWFYCKQSKNREHTCRKGYKMEDEILSMQSHCLNKLGKLNHNVAIRMRSMSHEKRSKFAISFKHWTVERKCERTNKRTSFYSF